jgi:signal transduction histidine kinase
LFTPAARRHIRLLVRALVPLAGRLERRFGAILRKENFQGDQTHALLAILPGAAEPLNRFHEKVAYHGRRLAKLNVALDKADHLLRQFDMLAAETLEGRFAPAREQLLLATLHHLHLAYYGVREAEAQVFFAISEAESEAADLEDLLHRVVGVLVRTFHAHSGRLVLGPRTGPSGPQYSKGRNGSRRCGWSYPLSSPGAIELEFATPYPWLPRELALIEAVAARCEVAIERSRSQNTIRRLEAEARAAEEEERRRIGRELHDEAGQALMALRLRLEMIEREAPGNLRGRVGEARAIAENIVVELRRIIAALSPAVLERLGLASALRQLAARFRKTNPAALRLRIETNGTAIPMAAQEVIYRVAQEGLQNAAKHSRAEHVNLSLRAADKKIRLGVSDDGIGFQTDVARRNPTSFGLAGMRERAALLGGTLVIRSAPSKGTRLMLELPVNYVKDSRTPH